MTSFLGSLAVLSCIYVAVFVCERIPNLSFRNLPVRRRFFATDVVWYLTVIGMSAIAVFLIRPLLEGLTIGPIARQIGDLPAVGRFAIALFLFDFVAYFVHRGLHTSDFLWSVHKVHHSSLELDGLATTRQHMFENMLRFLPGQVAMFLIGIPVAQIAPATAVFAAYSVIDHSNLNLDVRWMERLLITPRLHRRHHIPSISATHNYGGVFSIWDRVFGTLESMDTAPHERFGCPGEVDTYPQRFFDAVRQPPRDMKRVLASRRAARRLPAPAETPAAAEEDRRLTMVGRPRNEGKARSASSS